MKLQLYGEAVQIGDSFSVILSGVTLDGASEKCCDGEAISALQSFPSEFVQVGSKPLSYMRCRTALMKCLSL